MPVTTEIVVPVHDESRPIRRAVESLLKDDQTRALVVAHNIDPAVLDLPESNRVRVKQLTGHAGKPGACFDFGIANAEAHWVGIMGSDDWYEDGALAKMREHAEKDGADGVIAPLKHQLQDNNQIKPLTLRRKNLKAARDRMFYRTAPLGIYRREMLADERYRFGSEFTNGSDMRVTALLWTSGNKFSYYYEDPAYIVGRDAKTRVTFTPRPLSITAGPWIPLLNEPEVKKFDAKTRHALASKMAKVHVLSAVFLRPTKDKWDDKDFYWLKNYLHVLRDFDRAYDRGLSRRDQRILHAIEHGSLDDTIEANASWKSASLFDRALPSDVLSAVTAPESALRSAATALGRRLLSGDLRR